MSKRKGFTLVEILIVVVILGILAAIVIPQFTNASEAAKTESLRSQLQTIRSQLELYQVQHNGNYPAAFVNQTWDQMTTKTDQNGNADPNGFGPYLQQVPLNPFADPAANLDQHWTYDAATGQINAVDYNGLGLDTF